jgi:DNA-binding transcriptional LysR family regulator
VARALTPDEHRFAAFPLAPMEMLAACHPGLKLAKNGAIEIRGLAPYPLLQVLECRSPHALLAMAQAGHGVAIIPSALRIHRYVLRRLRILYRGKPLSEPMTVLYDKRRPMPSYARAFCDMLARHAKQVFPVSRG